MTKDSMNSYLLLCVDAVENSSARGRLYTSSLTREYFFSGTDQFLLTADAILNESNAGVPCVMRSSEAVLQAGKIATFKLNIRFCRNQTWQGSVMWMETRHEEHFRSARELLSIIHQALVPAQRQRMNPSSLRLVR